MNQTIDIKEGCKKLIVDFDAKTVVQEFEAEFVPQDGDFCMSDGYCICIFKCWDKSARRPTVYVGIYDNGTRKDALAYNTSGFTSGVKRLATDSERQQLLSALAKEGKTWNAEKKVVEKLRWRAKKGGEYFHVCTLRNFVVLSYDMHDVDERRRFERGNYFQSENEAKAMLARINSIFTENL